MRTKIFSSRCSQARRGRAQPHRTGNRSGPADRHRYGQSDAPAGRRGRQCRHQCGGHNEACGQRGHRSGPKGRRDGSGHAGQASGVGHRCNDSGGQRRGRQDVARCQYVCGWQATGAGEDRPRCGTVGANRSGGAGNAVAGENALGRRPAVEWRWPCV